MKVFRYELQVVRNGSANYKVIRNSFDAKRMSLELLGTELSQSPQEKMAVIALDTKNRPIGFYIATVGTVDASLVEPKVIFSRAICLLATSVILVHNHPSGDLSPSREDRCVTERLKEAGQILGVRVLDHIIIGYNPDSESIETFSLEEGGGR